jgi:hypothetical protein
MELSQIHFVDQFSAAVNEVLQERALNARFSIMERNGRLGFVVSGEVDDNVMREIFAEATYRIGYEFQGPRLESDDE